MTPGVVLLGPQRHRPTLGAVLRERGVAGRVATITAGWQERERDDRELDEHLEGRSVNLELYRRVEEAFERDPELAAAHRARQQRLRELRDVYRMRLGHALDAVAALLDRAGEPALLEPERLDAFEAVRALDARHLSRVRQVNAEFAERWRPAERGALARERAEVAAALEGAEAVAIAGGHVAVLLNRLRLLDVGPLVRGRLVVAWSAGAMAATERVVLFHDHPPQGPGHAEAFETGLGLAPGIVALPHARRRLRLDDRRRVAVLARRFAPAACVALDHAGSRVDLEGGSVSVSHAAPRLTLEGSLAEAA